MPLTAFMVVAQVLVAMVMPRSSEVQVLELRGHVADGQAGTKLQKPRPVPRGTFLERARGRVPGSRDRMPGSMPRHPVLAIAESLPPPTRGAIAECAVIAIRRMEKVRDQLDL